MKVSKPQFIFCLAVFYGDSLLHGFKPDKTALHHIAQFSDILSRDTQNQRFRHQIPRYDAPNPRLPHGGLFERMNSAKSVQPGFYRAILLFPIANHPPAPVPCVVLQTIGRNLRVAFFPGISGTVIIAEHSLPGNRSQNDLKTPCVGRAFPFPFEGGVGRFCGRGRKNTA